MRRMTLLAAVAVFLAAGCVDKAKADYDKCVELDKSYDVKGATAACSAAVAADRNSPSGQSAAKKLVDLQLVSAKIQDEQADKAARDSQVKKDEPLVVQAPNAQPTASTAAAPDPLADAGLKDVFEQAHAMFLAGDRAGAQALVDQVIPSGTKPTPEAVRAIKEVCKTKRDTMCALLKKRLR